MDLQDALRACNWTVADAMAKIRGEIQTTEVVKAKKKSSGPKKKALKAHDAFELSGSESDEEGEYTDNRVVYNSSDDSDADSDFELLERAGKEQSNHLWLHATLQLEKPKKRTPPLVDSLYILFITSNAKTTKE